MSNLSRTDFCHDSTEVTFTKSKVKKNALDYGKGKTLYLFWVKDISEFFHRRMVKYNDFWNIWFNLDRRKIPALMT